MTGHLGFAHTGLVSPRCSGTHARFAAIPMPRLELIIGRDIRSSALGFVASVFRNGLVGP